MLGRKKEEIDDKLQPPQRTAEQFAEAWLKSRRDQPGFRERAVLTPTGEIREVEICSFAQVPSVLQSLRSPGSRIKVSFPDLHDPTIAAEQCAIRKFFQSCHGKTSSDHHIELAQKLQQCRFFAEVNKESRGMFSSADAWLEAHGLNYVGPKTSFVVTDLCRGSDFVSTGVSEAARALSEHIESGRPLVTVVSGDVEPGKVAATLYEAVRNNSLLSGAMDSAKVWLFQPQPDATSQTLPTEVSLREFIDQYFAEGSDAGKHNEQVGGQPDGAHKAAPPASQQDGLPPSQTPDQDSASPLDLQSGNAKLDNHTQGESSCDGASGSATQDKDTPNPDAGSTQTQEPTKDEPYRVMSPDDLVAKMAAVLSETSNEKESSAIRTANEHLTHLLAKQNERAVDEEHRYHGGTDKTLYDILKNMIPKPKAASPEAVEYEKLSAEQLLEVCRQRSVGESANLLLKDLSELIKLRSELASDPQKDLSVAVQDNDLILLPTKGNALFLSDLEGRADLLAQIIDDRNLLQQWREGKGEYLCVLGDCVDRSDTGSLLIDFLLELKIRAGGKEKVVIIPGNHELSPSLHLPRLNFNWLQNYSGKEIEFLVDICTRTFAAEKDTEDCKKALQSLAEFAPFPKGFASTDGDSGKDKEASSRWGLYVLYNAVFHSLPKAALSENGLLALHAGIPTDGEFLEGKHEAGGISREERRKRLQRALAHPSAENIFRMAWSDVEDYFDGKSVDEYRDEMNTWVHSFKGDSDDLREAEELAAQSSKLFEQTDGRLSMLSLDSKVGREQRAHMHFRKRRGPSSLALCGKALDDFSNNWGVSLVLRGHQKRLRDYSLQDQKLGSVLKRVEDVDNVAFQNGSDVPWSLKNVVTVEGSREGWVVSFDLGKTEPTANDACVQKSQPSAKRRR